MNSGWRLNRAGFSYGGKKALADISCVIQPGGFYGVIGPNGSGKTTLVDLLTGGKYPDAGEVIFNGKPLSAWPRRQLARKIALVPQEFRVDSGFMVTDIVMMGRHPYIGRFGCPDAEDFNKVDAAMSALNIMDCADRPLTRLSGGEKQRVVVARALAQDTEALLLDEATSNLDINHTLHILMLSRRLVDEENRTVIVVLHDLNLAAAYCDQLLVLDQGRLVAQGPTASVMTAQMVEEVFHVSARVEQDAAYPRVLYQYRW